MQSNSAVTTLLIDSSSNVPYLNSLHRVISSLNISLCSLFVQLFACGSDIHKLQYSMLPIRLRGYKEWARNSLPLAEIVSLNILRNLFLLPVYCGDAHVKGWHKR